MKRRAVPAGLAAAVLAGCAGRLTVPMNPTLFPRHAVPAAPSGIALVVPTPIATQEARAAGGGGPAAYDLMLPIGRIVEAAVRAALDDRLPEALPGPVVAVEAVRFEYEVRVLWLLPVPVLGVIGQAEPGGQVAFDASLRDAGGTLAWTRRYDTGREVWNRPWERDAGGVHAIERRAHEAAYRLAMMLAADVGDWLETGRQRPREL